MSRCYECAEVDGFCTCRVVHVDPVITANQALRKAVAKVRALHVVRRCPCGVEPHEPKRASNGEVYCEGPDCRTCGGRTYPCATIRALDGGMTP